MKIINHPLFILCLLLNIKIFSLQSTSSKKPLIISFPFETKYIHEIPNDSNEDFYNDYGYDLIDLSFSPQNMINDWFYNGIYFSLGLGNSKKDFFLFLDVENSDFTIGPCNKINATSFHRAVKNFSYYFTNSSSYTIVSSIEEINKNTFVLSDKFTYLNQNISDLYLKFVYNKMKNENENEKEPLCGNIGLNVLDKSSDTFQTNLFRQLKDEELISNYIWTLSYRTEQFGNIILGGEPHFYDGKNFFMSQYKTVYSQIKINEKKEKISPWGFKFNNVYLNLTRKSEKKSKINNLENTEAELLIERGLIIGTQEYKDMIDKEFFDDLINNKTCKKDIVSFNDKVSGMESKYYVYSCERISFQGKDIYYSPIYSKPYFNFPSINFVNKELNYTFCLENSNLFIKKGRIYFLVIFEYESNNKIWKLGEPFLSKFKFVFNPDQKTIGFYNPNLPKIDNDIYIREHIGNDNDEIYEKEKMINKNYLWYYVTSIAVIIVLSIIAFYLAKKLHKARKKRANELDDSFDYIEADGPIESINK